MLISFLPFTFYSTGAIPHFNDVIGKFMKKFIALLFLSSLARAGTITTTAGNYGMGWQVVNSPFCQSVIAVKPGP